MKHKLSIRRTSFTIVMVALLLLSGTVPALAQAEIQAPTGSWLAQYWNGIDFAGTPPVQRIESSINHNWGAGSPDPAIQADYFSARWTGSFSLTGGTYRLRTRSDDGIRVRVNGNLVIDDWNLHPVTENMADVELPAGLNTFVVEYFEYTGDAVAFFEFDRVTAPPAPGTRGVNISPTSGPPGTVVQVHAFGFAPFAQVTIAVVLENGTGGHTYNVAANADGQLWTTVTIPGSAEPGGRWVVRATHNGQQAVSPVFTVHGTAPPTTSPCGPTYVVRPGDWLAQIARTCQVSYRDLLNANPQITNPSLIYAGMRLNIPQVGTPPPPPPPSVQVTARTRYNLNFRPVPTTASTPFRVIPAGRTVPVVARGPGGWIKVHYGGRVGWIAGWLTTIHGDLGALPFHSS